MPSKQKEARVLFADKNEDEDKYSTQFVFERLPTINLPSLDDDEPVSLELVSDSVTLIEAMTSQICVVGNKNFNSFKQGIDSVVDLFVTQNATIGPRPNTIPVKFHHPQLWGTITSVASTVSSALISSFPSFQNSISKQVDEVSKIVAEASKDTDKVNVIVTKGVTDFSSRLTHLEDILLGKNSNSGDKVDGVSRGYLSWTQLSNKLKNWLKTLEALWGSDGACKDTSIIPGMYVPIEEY